MLPLAAVEAQREREGVGEVVGSGRREGFDATGMREANAIGACRTATKSAASLASP
jgi:hypothetical protein